MSKLDKYVDMAKSFLEDAESFELSAENRDAVFEKVTELVAKVDTATSDGFQFEDVTTIIGMAVHTFMELAETTNLPGVDKQSLVVALVWRTYQLVDQGIDGNLNRIDIPWVPTVIERKIEEKVVKLATVLAIKAAHHFMAK